MSLLNNNIIDSVLSGKLKLHQSCDLRQSKAEINENSFDLNQFIEDYSHDMCTILAFFLHDKYNLKIGAIRAIDQNNDNDTDYETVVHQYVYLTDDLIVDARGIGTDAEMLDYYKAVSTFDDEDWDFMIDNNYQHDPQEKKFRSYDEHIDVFNGFLDLLGESLKSKIGKDFAQAND